MVSTAQLARVGVCREWGTVLFATDALVVAADRVEFAMTLDAAAVADVVPELADALVVPAAPRTRKLGWWWCLVLLGELRRWGSWSMWGVWVQLVVVVTTALVTGALELGVVSLQVSLVRCLPFGLQEASLVCGSLLGLE